MNNIIWDAVVWLRKKLIGDKEDILEAVNNVQNLFKTSADATATPSDIMAGKTAYNGTILMTGTIPDKGAWTGETTGSGNVAIPAGRHNGNGYVSGAGAYNAGVSATKKGTAAAGDVLTGKTFTNASSVGAAGTMLNNAAVTVDAGATTQDDTYTYLTVPSAAFYNANSKLRTKNSNIVIDLGVGTSFNVAKYAGYKNFTVNNFVVEPENASNNLSGSVSITGGSSPCTQYCEITKTKSYNASSGILTAYYSITGGMYIENAQVHDYRRSTNANVHAYLIP